MPDKFEAMWEQQKKFMLLLQDKRDFPAFPVDITSKSGQQFLDGIVYHAIKELIESSNHLKNSKSHRITELKDVDMEAYKEELADVYHLLNEVCIASGISSDELYEAYMKKGEKNVERIKNGY